MTRPRRDAGPGELTSDQRSWLEHGDPFAPPDVDASPFPSTAAEARAWAVHGDRITAEYRRQRPGKRPHAWWRHTAPEGRGRFGPPYSVVGDSPEELEHLPIEAANLAAIGELTEEERLHLASTSKDPGPTSR